MYYRSLFPGSLFAQMDRLQRAMQQSSDLSPSIRGMGRGGFPAINVGSTSRSLEIYAFVPGVDPTTIDLQLEKGVLTITGERKGHLPAQDAKTSVHIDERFIGRFRRVITLPDDVDAGAVQASCRDGVLHVNIPRRAATQPRRITIQ